MRPSFVYHDLEHRLIEDVVDHQPSYPTCADTVQDTSEACLRTPARFFFFFFKKKKEKTYGATCRKGPFLGTVPARSSGWSPLRGGARLS